MAISVVRRPSVRELSASPITRLSAAMICPVSASTRYGGFSRTDASGPALCLSKGPTCEHGISYTSAPCSVFLDEALTGTAELEPGAVHQEVTGSLPGFWSRHRQCLAASAHGRMVWHRETKTKQPKNGCNQPFGLASARRKTARSVSAVVIASAE
jgi:hypothetical protein